MSDKHDYGDVAVMKPDHEMSDGDGEAVGSNPNRPQTGNERSAELRHRLLLFKTEADIIKGNLHGAKTGENRWSK
jgi:hypothetical protein